MLSPFPLKDFPSISRKLKQTTFIACKSISIHHREKELAAVKINVADVDIIANELELDKKVAERTLREHKGDAVAAIQHLLR
ncbi:unnamed protein product [Ilex paraguariensis]|uniref:Nascent polypeptide-associated complex subunit alpha-like UBA domain-containing protein n=1 Tax=Ilex paraguariensis TaxID=185542 RepID=A0ABC8R1K2_9AQUA